MTKFRLASALLFLMLTVWLNAGSPQQDASSNPEDCLLLLKNRELVMGILPDLGAHVVLFRTVTGKNLLQSAPNLWAEPPPQISAEKPPFVPCNGHVYWIGPQKEWWMHQGLNADRKNRQVPWPPDPYLTLGRYEIVEQSADAVKLKGPASPVSGLQMLKEFSMKGNRVSLKVVATNISDGEVAWDLWSNTRLPGDAKVYVPFKNGTVRSTRKVGTVEEDCPPPYTVAEGFLRYDDSGAAAADREVAYETKTYLYPEGALVAAFNNRCLFLKRSTLVPHRQIHKDQGLVEISRVAGKNVVEPLMEVEMHGAYTRLTPGESMSFEESWEIVPCGDLPDAAARLKFLKEVLNLSHDSPENQNSVEGAAPSHPK